MATRIPASSAAVPSALCSIDRASLAMCISPDRSGSGVHASTGYEPLRGAAQQVGDLLDRPDAGVGQLADAGWRLGRDDADAQRPRLAALAQDGQGPERVRVGHV